MSGVIDKRIPSLDGLRAVAVSIVLASHASTHPDIVGTIAYYVMHKLFDGSVGVQIFFVISGFIITHLLNREYNKNGYISLKGFYLRRFYRLIPAFVVFMGVLYVLNQVKSLGIKNIEFVSALLFFRNHVESGGWYTGHIWSLSVEEQFYLVWPLYLVLLWKRSIALALMAVVLAPVFRLYCVSHDVSGANYWLFANMDCLAAGCLLALWYSTLKSWEANLSDQHRAWLRGLSFVTFILIAVIPGRYYPVLWPFYGTIISAAAVFLILSLTTTTRGVAFAVLNWRPVAQLGVLSYSIYLWQQIFLFSTPVFELPLPISIVAILFIAALSWALLEKPFIQLRRRLHD